MQHKNLFVFDIETVPDTDCVPNLTGFDEPDVAERRAEMERYHLEATGGKNAFPRQPFHKVVAISFLEAEIERDDNGETFLLRDLRSGGEADYDEKRLLQGFFSYIERQRPRLVSFNGRSFDLSVLKYRAMVHGVAGGFLYRADNKWENYSVRYAPDWHCDLLEVLSDYGASARVKLNEVCAAMKFPGKFGIDGSEVAPLFDAGRLSEIRDYCETDVLNTYLVYLRWAFHTGRTSLDAHNRAIADLIAMIKMERDERPHLGLFLQAWGEASDNNFTI